MTANISTTINVYAGSNGLAQYSPTAAIDVPKDTKEVVTYTGLQPSIVFVRNSVNITNRSGLDPGRIVVAYAPGGDFADHFTVSIDNSGANTSVARPDWTFGFVDLSRNQQPPAVIDGSGSIRNKGTSIWVWELLAVIAAVLFAGVLIGRTIEAGPELGPIATVLLALGAGSVASAMYSRMQAKGA
jgi:hypothetical protein